MERIKDLAYSIGHRLWLGRSRGIKGRVVYVGATGKYSAMATSSMPTKAGNTVRVVCISDTHGRHQDVDVPAGDVLCFAGDMLLINRHFSHTAGVRQVRAFSKWLKSLPHSHKIVIAGNHDAAVERIQTIEGLAQVKKVFDGCHYLQDDGVANCMGLRIWGSPYSRGSSENDAFQSNPKRRLDAVPTGVDLLITHGPLRSGDLARMRPRVHLCGHIHGCYGVKQNADTICLNASIMDGRYRPWHPPIVIDIPVMGEVDAPTP